MTLPLAPLRSVDVGDVRVTYLPDGGGTITKGTFPTTDAECWARHGEWLADEERWVLSIGGFLVESGDSKVLVDLGFGEMTLEVPDFATVTCGALLDSLKQAGVSPEDVDAVVYTHMHSDHTGWTSTGDNLTFPNARHLAGPGELSYWTAHADDGFAPPLEGVRQPLENRLEEPVDGTVVAPGVTISAAYGHTPGHQCVAVSSGTQRALIVGDTVHCAAQVAEPEMSIMFDVDPARARESRDRILDGLAGTDTLVGACHFARSAFGRVLLGEGKRYWGPLD